MMRGADQLDQQFCHLFRGRGGGDEKNGAVYLFSQYCCSSHFRCLGLRTCVLIMIASVVVVWNFPLRLFRGNDVGDRLRVYVFRTHIGFVVQFVVVGGTF